MRAVAVPPAITTMSPCARESGRMRHYERMDPPSDERGTGPEPSVPMRHAVTVAVPPERAFELFTTGIGSWWPLDDYSRAVSEFAADGLRAVRLEFQARDAGSLLEHVSDGRVLPWAEVTTWDPPRRVVLAWRPHSLPEPPTELDVSFEPQRDGTLVRLEHRGWNRVSQRFRDELYGVYARGWPTTMERFVNAAAEP